MKWIDRLANGPTKAFGGVKRLVANAFHNEINSHMALEHAYWGASSRTLRFPRSDQGAFAKRPVKFTGA